MRHIAILLALVFLAAFNTGAQTLASNSSLLPSSYFAVPAPAIASGNTITLTPSPFTGSSNATPTLAPSTPLSLLPAAPAPAQDVASVFETYDWQIYLGYTFFRFYELPHITQNMNGFDYGMVYYVNNWFGVDGEFDATHGNQSGYSSWFVAGYGGPRFRWSARKGIELWAHALIGYSHFTPQTADGPQHALAYQFGGGADLPFHPRWAIRVGADAVGTRYFSTYQFSPKAFAGVVFKF
ncbi:MAG: hypothetical protein WA211_10360 [Candidatus Acidiferrales bacterium]|jgi:hypothetical protein